MHHNDDEDELELSGRKLDYNKWLKKQLLAGSTVFSTIHLDDALLHPLITTSRRNRDEIQENKGAHYGNR